MKVLVGLVVAAFVAFYLISDPFKTQVDAAIEDNTTWTDQKIIDDPANYLVWSEKELQSIESKLKAQKLTLRTKLNSLEKNQKSDQLLVSQTESKLGDWKDSYRSMVSAANDADGGKISEPYTLDQLKSLILQADARIRLTNTRLEAYVPSILEIEGRIAEIDEHLHQVGTSIEEVGSIKARIDINASVTDYQGLLASVESLVTTVESLDDITTPDAISLDAALAADRKLESDRLFDDIIAEK
ncbi:hypothetical protein NOR53_871 [gamma proteobacterium NOR5-3]|nr:hypothetical protein NOR53_871 [gamma proteobacterium NOR5-3]